LANLELIGSYLDVLVVIKQKDYLHRDFLLLLILTSA